MILQRIFMHIKHINLHCFVLWSCMLLFIFCFMSILFCFSVHLTCFQVDMFYFHHFSLIIFSERLLFFLRKLIECSSFKALNYFVVSLQSNTIKFANLIFQPLSCAMPWELRDKIFVSCYGSVLDIFEVCLAIFSFDMKTISF